MATDRRPGQFRVGFAASAAVLVLAGAVLVDFARSDGVSVAIGGLAGLLALATGALHRSWRRAIGTGAAALLLAAVAWVIDGQPASLAIQVGGLVVIGAGGALGVIAYRSMAGQIERHTADVDALNAELGRKHQAFVTATSDLNAGSPGDTAAITAAVAGSVGADFACCYLASADGRRFVPQPPGIGVDLLRPQAVNRPHGNAGPMLSAVDAGIPFASDDENAIVELISFVPEDFHLQSLIAAPMRIGDHVGGFIVLGRKTGRFSEDDRRLAMTLTARAGEHVTSSQLLALTRQESARYSLMNELIKDASGKTMHEVLELVLARGPEVVRYDSGRALVFQEDSSYVVLDGGAARSEPIDGPLARVRDGETMLRNLVTEDEVIFSGLPPDHLGGTVNEAITPIRGKSGVIGALCLGRRGNAGFTQQDLGALSDLGSMAGVAVENSRILQVVTGQASRLDTALDALEEVSAALTTVTQGSKILEQKTLEAAIKIVGGTAGMLTRADPNASDCQVAIMAVWLATDPAGIVFQNGEGIVGATMLSRRATVISDLSWHAELASPPDLTGLKAAVCTPMLDEGRLWGTLSVFDDKTREWTSDDQRVLATLANQSVVAVRNAELYEKSESSNWELRNLQAGLQAATKTLELNQVLKDVLEGAAKAVDAKIGCLALEESGKLILRAPYGTDHVQAQRLALVEARDICDDVMQSGEPVMQAIDHEPAKDSPSHPRAVLCVPITLHDKPQGVLFLANYEAGHVFTEEHRKLVTELAVQAAFPIENARLFKDREEVILASLEALARTVDARDPYTRGHSGRVTEYARMIARQMHYAPNDPSAWTRLERGASLHDIGKIGVPDAILSKAGKLTDEEFDKMKSHTTVGYNILSALKMLTDELVIVRSHHERYDGKGYPDRKKGDDLPMFAWIVSAADAIDAMTSDRPYRRAMSMEVAVDQVRLGAGTHFHPDVAEAVLDAVAGGTLKVIQQTSMYADAPAIGAFENPVA